MVDRLAGAASMIQKLLERATSGGGVRMPQGAASPYGGGLAASSPYGGGLQAASPYGAAMQPSSPYGGGLQAASPYSGGLRAASPYGGGLQARGVRPTVLAPSLRYTPGVQAINHPERARAPGTAIPGQSGQGLDWGGSYDGSGVGGWLAQQRPGSPLVPIAGDIVNYAQSQGVDPALIFGQLQAESGFASDSGLGTRQNNPGNIMAPGADPANGNIVLRSYPTMLDGVKAQIDTLASYNQQYGQRFGAANGGRLTMEQMVAIYYVGPEAYAKYGLNANDAGGQGPGGNGTVQQYLDRHVYPVRQALAPYQQQGTGGKLGGPVQTGVAGPVTAGTRPLAGATGVLATGQRYLGTPYQWGGASPATNFDCSGLTQYAYAQNGVTLPRTAQAQFDATTRIGPADLQAGDLVFFTDTYETNEAVTHVGIYAGRDAQGHPIMLNSANGGVTYADMSTPYWQAHYFGAGRVRQ